MEDNHVRSFSLNNIYGGLPHFHCDDAMHGRNNHINIRKMTLNYKRIS